MTRPLIALLVVGCLTGSVCERPGYPALEATQLAPDPHTPAVCYVVQLGSDGIGHQLFGMMSVMGLHGVSGDGRCYVYNAVVHGDFGFAHFAPGSKPWKETHEFMTGFAQDFQSKIGPSGCATAALLAEGPSHGFNRRREDGVGILDLECGKAQTWAMDNAWWIPHPSMMEFVVKNATRAASLAAAHLPRLDSRASLVVHMRFGDAWDRAAPATGGQRALFGSISDAGKCPLACMVFTDDAAAATSLLEGTPLAGTPVYGPAEATILQAMAHMVAADVFVGSRTDVSSSAAMMRIGLGKKHTHAVIMELGQQIVGAGGLAVSRGEG